jgi:hypothetical protein
LRDDFGAVNFMDPAAEHRRRQNAQNRRRIEIAFAYQSERLSKHFQCGRHHGIADELDQVGALGVAADDEGALAQKIEQRTATIERITGPGRDDEQLTGLRRIGIPKYRRRDISLAMFSVLRREFACRGRVDRAHREMHGVWLQTRGQPRFPGFSEYCLANRGGVRQHADDEIAVEQIGNAEFRLEAEVPNFRRAVWTANIGNHPAAAGHEIRCHGAAHMTQPDKADASVQGPALAMPNRELHVILIGQ